MHKLGFTFKKAKYYGKAKNALALTCTFLRLRDKYLEEGRQLYAVDETGSAIDLRKVGLAAERPAAFGGHHQRPEADCSKAEAEADKYERHCLRLEVAMGSVHSTHRGHGSFKVL